MGLASWTSTSLLCQRCRQTLSTNRRGTMTSLRLMTHRLFSVHRPTKHTTETPVVNVMRLHDQYAGITVFSLDRPQVRNAINFDVLYQLRQAIKDAENDRETRVIIVTSQQPRMFCAGADLKERHGLPDDEYRRWSWTIRRMTSELADLKQTTLAAIDGAALGGGLELALACDIRVAASNVKLGLPETTLGIIPGAGGSQRLPRVVGSTFAKELIYTGRILRAQQAKDRYGLVNFVVDQNEHGTAAYEYSTSIALEHIQITKEDGMAEECL